MGYLEKRRSEAKRKERLEGMVFINRWADSQLVKPWKRWQCGLAVMRLRLDFWEADGEVLTVRSEAIEA